MKNHTQGADAGTRALLTECKSHICSLLPRILEMRYHVTYKPDGSPVTSADRYLEDTLRDWLARRLPNLTFVGEETFDYSAIAKDGYVALLDPIDGTENFCSGLTEWGVSLGLWRDGHHAGSLLLLPEMGLHLMTGDTVVPISSRITGFSSSYHPDIGSGIQDAVEYRVTGCAVYNIFNVIRGAFARFINPKGAWVWDILPGAMLALEHNCVVKLDNEIYNGEFVDPTRRYRIDIRHGQHLHPGQRPIDRSR